VASTFRLRRARASWCAWRAAGSSTWSSTCGGSPPTFGEWEAFELDDVGAHQLWIPIGFGHGFCVLSETADFVYKCTSYYDPATESGIRFDDPEVGIEWPEDVELIYSERDRAAPSLSHLTAADRSGSA